MPFQFCAWIWRPLAPSDQEPSPWRVPEYLPPGINESCDPSSQQIFLPDKSAAVASFAIAGEAKQKTSAELAAKRATCCFFMIAPFPNILVPIARPVCNARERPDGESFSPAGLADPDLEQGISSGDPVKCLWVERADQIAPFFHRLRSRELVFDHRSGVLSPFGGQRGLVRH
jgi:hypothetical protein